MRATYPVCYKVDDNEWCCEMRDRKTGRTWGTGYSTNREHAITLARQDQPKEMFIKRAGGWIKRHPILAGVTMAGYMMLRRPIQQIAFKLCDIGAQITYSLRFPNLVVKGIQNAWRILP